jgi:hypothetical protein
MTLASKAKKTMSRIKLMQQPHEREVTVYADIGEVRMEVQPANCNRLLADGWVLLGIYPLTTVREMEQRPLNGEQTKKQDTQSRVPYYDN